MPGQIPLGPLRCGLFALSRLPGTLGSLSSLLNSPPVKKGISKIDKVCYVIGETVASTYNYHMKNRIFRHPIIYDTQYSLSEAYFFIFYCLTRVAY